MNRCAAILCAFLVFGALCAPLAAQLPVQAPKAQPTQAAPVLPQTPAAPGSGLRVVVLDAAHGGTDAGARGPSGVLEKDVVLALARALKADLVSRGWQVVLTRDGNDNPSFDDRAAIANRQRGAVFLTLHVASTGPPGTVRSYFPIVDPTAVEVKPAAERPALVPWDLAQAPYLEQSRRLAELLQVQLGQKFRGSPEVPGAAGVRQLRSVMAPAVAVEISSVAVKDASALLKLAPDLAAAVARAVDAFRPLYDAGGN